MSSNLVATFVLALLAAGPGQESEKSPEQVYSAYCKALVQGDADTYFACVTPKYWESYMFGILFGFGLREYDLKPHLNEAYALKALKEAGERVSDERRNTILAASIRNKNAFFKDYANRFAKEIKDETSEPLRKVEIKGVRARGYLKRYLMIGPAPESKQSYPYDSPEVFFAHTESGWRIDNPTPDEIKQHARELADVASKYGLHYGSSPPAAK